MRKAVIVFGTRPEAIKLCPIINELKKRNSVDVRVVVTGQHKQLLYSVLDVFGISPDYDLSIMRDEQTLFEITISVMSKMKKILETENPDVVLVHGDTTTAFSTALACFYMRIPIGHVEAGLRTYDTTAPYPEEFNRQALDIISDYYFAPTEDAKRNLINEGRDSSRIWITGNTIVDAMRYTISKSFDHPELQWAMGSRLVLITAHRRENLNEPMHMMFRAIRRVLDEHRDVKAIFPIHLNPVVRRVAKSEFEGCENIHIIEPLDVFDFHNFESRCYLCLTDSGGIQEECVSIGKPVLLMRDITERPEGIETGTIRLVGSEEERIYSCFSELLDDDDAYNRMLKRSNIYGDGQASEMIIDILMKEILNER
ncbi:MAG: UDP-N-acetylglucosamine 2-epimerase (non-hydrolyzing) [Clostridiales bacterium]|nr:UDP-N-acetylglucosamine 2-epimerase (non-hydrolyzing) [Clostridiales bacterium]